MQKQPLRLGVDVAGTCADAVLGRGCDLFSTKVLPPLQRARRDDYQGYGLHLQAYERFNTTIIKAYIKPLMKTYLNRLKGRLNDPGPQRLHDDCPWRRGSTWWRVGRLYGG